MRVFYMYVDVDDRIRTWEGSTTENMGLEQRQRENSLGSFGKEVCGWVGGGGGELHVSDGANQREIKIKKTTVGNRNIHGLEKLDEYYA